MKILLDMNISPDWVEYLKNEGFEAVHWVSIGWSTAPDTEIFNWAAKNGFVIFTHDLDFSAILAATNASAPSVFQFRTQDSLPSAIGKTVTQILQQFETQFEQGILLSYDTKRTKVRILPFN
jgi:predicted nuclease of predicted toxin-antitoxin system